MSFKATETGLIVWVADDEPRFKCTVITSNVDGERTYCLKPFASEQEWIAHTTRCAREHEQAIMESRPSHRLPEFYGPESGIPDVEEWLNRSDASGTTHRQKIIEGRERL